MTLQEIRDRYTMAAEQLKAFSDEELASILDAYLMAEEPTLNMKIIATLAGAEVDDRAAARANVEPKGA